MAGMLGIEQDIELFGDDHRWHVNRKCHPPRPRVSRQLPGCDASEILKLQEPRRFQAKAACKIVRTDPSLPWHEGRKSISGEHPGRQRTRTYFA
jgi:hypothetical protein